MNKKYIFVLQMEESGEYFAGHKEDVDNEIRQYEDNNEDLPFKTVGRILEPPGGLPMGFNSQLIEWIDTDFKPTKQDIDSAALAIVEILR